MRPVKIIKTSIPNSAVVRFWVLASSVCLLTFCYAFLLIGTTLASGQVRQAEQDMTKAKTEIASLEVEYFTRVSQISSDDVSRLNMKEPNDNELTYIDLDKKTSELVLR